MMRIAVLASGGGSNLQSLLDAQRAGGLGGEIVRVISNKRSAFALERARLFGAQSVFVSKREDPASYERRLREALDGCGADLVVLAGFLSILGDEVLGAYQGRILNVHPALLPSFGGVGMYGHHVHEAVLAAGCKVSGATVHFVTQGVDAGPIVMQRAVQVLEDDDAHALAARVLCAEHEILPAAVALYCRGALRVEGRRVWSG